MQQMVAALREKESKLARDKKGFTLVELIVVLVILAILAAILVPTLIGYINQANTEKDYSTAQTVRVAAQSVLSDQYGRAATDEAKAAITTINQDSKTASGQTVLQLAGVDDSHVKSCSFTVDANGQLGDGTVVIDGSTYTYTASTNQWTAAATN